MPQIIDVPGHGPTEFPDGMSESQIVAAIQKNMVTTQPKEEPGFLQNLGLGALKGASDIGATILSPLDAMGVTGMTPEQRRKSLTDFYQENADPESMAFQGGELGTNLAGTMGVGGVLGKGALYAGSKIPAIAQWAQKLAPALESGGFRLGTPAATTTGGKVADMAVRTGAGATTGAVTAGLIDPESAGEGALIGGAMPGSVKAAGALGAKLAPNISPEVKALYAKAKSMGIDIPMDRIMDSRPMNAVAASLNYLPFSGRAATEDRMLSQMNRALSRTFGQDSSNVTMALRKANNDLGQKFDQFLTSNSVNVDPQFVNDMQKVAQRASSELSPDQAKIVFNQIQEIFDKGASGQISGQAAYNIKKTLDRIGKRNSNEAYYARELKRSLMGVLERSVGPQEAQGFAQLRKQYGNMLDLENLATNGVEGEITAGRLANLKHVNNQELQDVADIAAQFIKTRENPHGAMQRVAMGGMGLGLSASNPMFTPAVGGTLAGGRLANMLMNSDKAKGALLSNKKMADLLMNYGSSPLLRTLPTISATNP